MTHNALGLQKLVLGLVLLVTCMSIVGSSSSRERRYVGVEESSHRPGRIHTPGSRSFKSSTSKNNEITAEPGRKVSHRLIGGHLRADTKEERDEALWDDGILMSSAGNGKEGKNTRGDEDDEKKTLSQQVKEGKYGLIQNEIYGDRPNKRPGIISYLGNPEVPKDTIENLGGLDEDEIWLAENHVLVLRGGKFPGHEVGQGSGDGAQTWPPIDNYKAPRRQVKIPSRPKVPPPFPVQLTEGGPVQIIGPNGTKEISNVTLDYSKDPLYTKGLLPGEGPLFAILSNASILTPDSENSRNYTIEEKSVKSSQEQKRTKSDPLPLSGLPPFYHAIPPGAVFVPPPSNQSDYDDEDQSIYYPPPYSFYYKQDNTTAVPPGPLVPGIILPPPPDFFSALDEKKSTTKKYTKRPGTTPVPRLRPTYLPPRKLTTKRYKSTTTVPTVETRTPLPVTTRLYSRTMYKNSTRTTSSSVKTAPYIEITTPTSEKPTTLDNPDFYTIRPVGNQVSETSTQDKSRGWSELGTSKGVPILTYYAPSTQSSLERPIEVTPASIKNIITTPSSEKSSNQASYYFYEESTDETVGTTANPSALYYRTTTESPHYRVETHPQVEERKKQYYSVETIPSQETSKDYSVKFIDSLVKNQQVFQYSDTGSTQASSKYESSPARTQGQRMLADHAPVYYQAISARPAVAVQSYYTTPKPQSYYRQDTKPKPIYQYSFEAADYSKHSNQRQPNKQQQSISYSEYHDIKAGRHQYDYEDSESVPEQQLRPESVPYKTQHLVYPSTTPHSVISTTPNPHHAYFTQQDEKLLDDVTKEYFTIFGKKLPGKGLPSTTPIYGKSSSVTERPNYDVNTYVQNNYNAGKSPVYKTPNVKVEYGDQPQRPYSLAGDTLVNERKPLPPINPDSEFITVVQPKPQKLPFQRYRIQTEDYRLQNQGNQRVVPIRGYTPQQIVEQGNGPSADYPPSIDSPEEIDETYSELPGSLLHDIDVNYRDPRPTINPDAEYIDPIPVQDNRPEKPKAYFAYRLPGDGGHFYFLTPQAITQRQEQNGGYLYPKSRGTRLLRRRRRPGNV